MRARDQRARRGATWCCVGAVACVAVLVLSSGSWSTVAFTALIYATIATSWNLTLGMAGVFNFAQIAFFALGAYAVAIATSHYGWSPWEGLALGGAVGAGIGALVYAPLFRIRGIYVALVTFVVSQVCADAVMNLPGFTGGSGGLVGIPNLSIGAFSFAGGGGVGYGLAAVGLLMVCVGCVDVLYHSQVGWALEAVRDDERYAVSRGLPVYRLQMSAFVVSGLFAGLAGGLFVLYFSAASPDLFGFSYLTLVLAMVFLGGVNTVYGPVAGAVVLTTVGNVVQNAATASLIVPGVIIVAVLLFFRTGLVGVLPAVSRGWGDLRAGQRTSSWGRCVWRRGDGFTKGRKRG